MKMRFSLGFRTWLVPVAVSAFAAWAVAGCSDDGANPTSDQSSLPDAGGSVPDADGSLPDAGDIHVEGEVTLETHEPDLPPLAGFDTCRVELGSVTLVDSPHHDECTPIHYPSHPATVGPHYPVWAAWRSYRGPIPAPYLVHNLEHGGIVLLYNCPEGCPDLLESLETLIAEFPADEKCSPPVRARFILAEDPELDVPLAAAAWGHFYKATCLDLDGLRAFVEEHYAKAPEDTCKDGFDFTAPEGGTIEVCTNGKGGTGDPGMSKP